MTYLVTIFPFLKSESRPIEACDARHSKFLELPTELILKIHGYLELDGEAPSVARMVLHATCRRFHYILDPLRILAGKRQPGQYRVGVLDRRLYSSLRFCAKFRSLCAKEREQLLGDRLVCCVCLSTHEADRFTPEQRSAEPEKRFCITAEDLLFVCPHVQYSSSMLGSNRAIAPGRTGWYRNLDGHLPCMDERFREPRQIRARWEVGEGRSIEEGAFFRLEVKIMDRSDGKSGIPQAMLEDMEKSKETTKKKELWKESIVDAVKKTNIRVCPHMHTSDATTEQLVRELLEYRPMRDEFATGWARRWTIWSRAKWTGRTNVSGACSLWPGQKCRVRSCDTTVTLLRELVIDKGYPKDFWVLKIERRRGGWRSDPWYTIKTPIGGHRHFDDLLWTWLGPESPSVASDQRTPTDSTVEEPK